MEYRIEKDTMGEIKVPKDAYWGAGTQRSIENFNIGIEKMPIEILRAFSYLKKAIALVNKDLNILESKKANAIINACEEMIEGKFDNYYPLSVWQTGSGTQSNMNINEVLANRATQILGGDFSKEKLVHPNDDVNKSQSSNDTFPSAIHIAAVILIEENLLPTLERFIITLKEKVYQFKDIVKVGRTHLQDATTLTLGEEISGWLEMLIKSQKMIEASLEGIRELAIGGTAVGTGLNAHPELGIRVSKKVSELTGHKFISAPNKFHALTSHDALVFSHGALKALASNMMKIANDVRWLASGPRCGLGEIEIPANEPGSSIMPGKINPTQSEAVTMVAVQVMGNDATIGFAASQGNFELNVFKPVIAYNFLQSVKLLNDSIKSFDKNCIKDIKPLKENIEKYVENSLMNITALNPYIGYENCAKIVKSAYKNKTTLKEEALKLGIITETDFDRFLELNNK
jgi:fumarate hydratase class II